MFTFLLCFASLLFQKKKSWTKNNIFWPPTTKFCRNSGIFMITFSTARFYFQFFFTLASLYIVRCSGFHLHRSQLTVPFYDSLRAWPDCLTFEGTKTRRPQPRSHKGISNQKRGWEGAEQLLNLCPTCEHFPPTYPLFFHQVDANAVFMEGSPQFSVRKSIFSDEQGLRLPSKSSSCFNTPYDSIYGFRAQGSRIVVRIIMC